MHCSWPSAARRVQAILVTHCHADHSPLAAWLSAETGAPTFGFGPHPRPGPGTDPIEAPDDGVEIEESTDHDFVPDEAVTDGDLVVSTSQLTMRAMHTPGHTSNHTCWTLAEESALFTGDHVMGWSTTVVSPPDGDMVAYIDSLRRVADRDDAMLWPTHGPPRDDGRSFVEALVEHRLERERGVLTAVRDGRTSIPEIVALLYADVRQELHKPAGRSVWAHLVKLVADGQVAVDGGGVRIARCRLSSRVTVQRRSADQALSSATASVARATSANRVVSGEHPSRITSGSRKSASTLRSTARRGTRWRASG